MNTLIQKDSNDLQHRGRRALNALDKWPSLEKAARKNGFGLGRSNLGRFSPIFCSLGRKMGNREEEKEEEKETRTKEGEKT